MTSTTVLNSNERYNAYLATLLRPVIGAKVVAFCRPPADDEFADDLFGLKFDTGYIAWVMCDPEGNGAGFLEIEKEKIS